MKRIGFCGGPSTGKTTIARELTNKLGLMGYNCDNITEYARFHINQCIAHFGKFECEPLDQVILFENQLKSELSVSKKLDYIITDSPIFMGLSFLYRSLDLNNYKHKKYYMDYYEKLIELRDFYDYIFFIPNEFKLVDDGTRVENDRDSIELGESIKSYLKFHQIPFTEVSGTVEERIKTCFEVLGVE
jgi:nicotinamide riboside kinase